jgi:hypothetical protein
MRLAGVVLTAVVLAGALLMGQETGFAFGGSYTGTTGALGGDDPGASDII